MDKPTLVKFSQVAQLLVQQYEPYLPGAYDEGMTILQKLNKIIQYCNELGLLTNEVIAKWNEVMQWVMEDGLWDAVNKKIDEMVEDGTMDDIINVDLFNQLRDAITALENRSTAIEGINTRQDSDITVLRADFEQLVEDVDKTVKDALSPFMERTDKLIVNVLQFGAVGDGVTDNSQAFKDAMEVVKDGGTIYIPYGDYLMHDFAELYPNVSVIATKGTIIRKNMNSISAYTFVTGRTRGTSGYGGSTKNNYIYGITFQGYAESGTRYYANGLILNHSQDFHINDCEFRHCIFNGHALDLGGCDDILIENTDFIGCYNNAGKEYTEAIQIDSSTPTGTGSEYTGLDALPTKNVTIRGCKFLPSVDLSGGYMPAPNPLGNHGHTAGKFYENILFEDNEVVDGPTSDGGGWRGWIHFYAVKGLKILNNTFKLTKNINARPIGVYVSGGGQYDPVTLVSGSGVPQISRDIVIEGNTFEGFKYDQQVEMIRMYGTTYNSTPYRVLDVRIENNKFLENGVGNGSQDQYAPLIMISSFERLKIHGNEAVYGQRLASVFTGELVTITENKGVELTGNFIYCADCTTVVIKGNESDGCRAPLETEELTNVVIADNINVNVKQYTDEGFACKFRNIINGVITGNVTQTADPNINYAMYVYLSPDAGTSDNVLVVDNIHSGFSGSDTNPTPVNTSGGVTNLTIR